MPPNNQLYAAKPVYQAKQKEPDQSSFAAVDFTHAELKAAGVEVPPLQASDVEAP
jgi:hypothetical protein